MNIDKTMQDLRATIDQVSTILVNEVIEEVENLYNLRSEVAEDHKDGVDEEISMELDRLRFHNIKLGIPGMPTEGLAGILGALVRELWNERVQWLLEQRNAQDPDVKISVRL